AVQGVAVQGDVARGLAAPVGLGEDAVVVAGDDAAVDGEVDRALRPEGAGPGAVGAAVAAVAGVGGAPGGPLQLEVTDVDVARLVAGGLGAIAVDDDESQVLQRRVAEARRVGAAGGVGGVEHRQLPGGPGDAGDDDVLGGGAAVGQDDLLVVGAAAPVDL